MSPTKATQLDLVNWPAADHFRYFRKFERPHFAVTSRIDVTRLKDEENPYPVFRSCIWAIGAGLNSVPQLQLRFKDEHVYKFDRIDLSATISVDDGDFRFAFFDWSKDRQSFDAHAAKEIAKVRADASHDISGNRRPNLAYLSCLPWMDYTSLDNAMPNADDCTPRVGWGKIVPTSNGYDMAMTLQVHHALVHGLHVAQFFSATQKAFNSL